MNKILNKIEKWIKQNGFKLKFIKFCIDEVNFDTKTVEINKCTKLSNQITTLLHECGHILIYIQRKKYKLKTILGLNWNQWEKIFENKKSKKKYISILHEEIEAWDRGKKLAKRLKIKIKNKVWNYHRTRCLMTYIKIFI